MCNHEVMRLITMTLKIKIKKDHGNSTLTYLGLDMDTNVINI